MFCELSRSELFESPGYYAFLELELYPIKPPLTPSIVLLDEFLIPAEIMFWFGEIAIAELAVCRTLFWLLEDVALPLPWTCCEGVCYPKKLGDFYPRPAVDDPFIPPEDVILLDWVWPLALIGDTELLLPPFFMCCRFYYCYNKYYDNYY